MPPKPYVGITGPTTIADTRALCSEFSDAGYTLNKPHQPMLGFLVSYKTLNGQPTTNKRYPKVNELSQLLQATEGTVFTMIHYNSRETDTLAQQVALIFNRLYSDKLCQALQLNIMLPPHQEIKKIKEQFPDMQIILQVQNSLIYEKTPMEIVNVLKHYEGCPDHILIDPSGGRGIEFNVNKSLALYSWVKQTIPYLSIGFAGGFTGQNVATRCQEIIQELKTNDFSIDAEGGLRDKLSPEYGDDLLNLQKCRDYIQEAVKVLK
ncbi:hypothetical protein HYU21_01700 [Candidatus Woesearchaeota archaeon]|nr:hypothetical protein [Candidatus Woesearchaeota archaeon]